jgi:hypothetical protein
MLATLLMHCQKIEENTEKLVFYFYFLMSEVGNSKLIKPVFSMQGRKT